MIRHPCFVNTSEVRYRDSCTWAVESDGVKRRRGRRRRSEIGRAYGDTTTLNAAIREMERLDVYAYSSPHNAAHTLESMAKRYEFLNIPREKHSPDKFCFNGLTFSEAH